MATLEVGVTDDLGYVYCREHAEHAHGESFRVEAIVSETQVSSPHVEIAAVCDSCYAPLIDPTLRTDAFGVIRERR